MAQALVQFLDLPFVLSHALVSRAMKFVMKCVIAAVAAVVATLLSGCTPGPVECAYSIGTTECKTVTLSSACCDEVKKFKDIGAGATASVPSDENVCTKDDQTAFTAADSMPKCLTDYATAQLGNLPTGR